MPSDGWRRDELDAALVGAGRALQTVASVLLMADPRDLGMVAQVQSPHAEQPGHLPVGGGARRRGPVTAHVRSHRRARRRGPRPGGGLRLRGRLPGLRRTARREPPRRTCPGHAPAAPAGRPGVARRDGTGRRRRRDSRAGRPRRQPCRAWIALAPAVCADRDWSGCATRESVTPARCVRRRSRNRGRTEPRAWPRDVGGVVLADDRSVPS